MDFALLLWDLKYYRFVANDIFVALHTSQSQLRHNFTLYVSTEVIESRILSSIYKLLTLDIMHINVTHSHYPVNISAQSIVS